MAAATATALVSEPPRPSVVMLPAASVPWNPATTAISPRSTVSKIFEPSIALMRALVCASSVRIFTWWPSNDRARPPSAWMAMAVSAALTCSPVAAMASISRASGTLATSCARASRRLVSPLIALTMRTTLCPAFCVAMARRATLRMRSTEPTDVPPYFWTTSATGHARLVSTPRSVNRLGRTSRRSARLAAAVSPYAGYLVETFVTLLAVCALAVLVLWGARRLGIGRPSGPIELRGHLPLDARRSIYLVKVGDAVFVVGVGEGGFTKLGEIPAASLPAVEAAKAPAFADVLAKVLGRGKGQP